jgi:hypothetical protein
MDDNNELVIYVLQQLRYGVPEQSVRANLAQNGWPQPLIDRAFSMVQQAAPHNLPSSNTYPQQQPTPVSDLPTPAEDPFPAIETQKKVETKGRTRRVLLITVITLVLLGLASFGGLLIYKAVQQHNRTADKSATTSQEKPAQKKKEADLDTPRKEKLDSLADALNAYYTKKQTYPTLAQLNDPAFAATEGNVDGSKYKDPAFDAKKSDCVDEQGRTLFTEIRTPNCFSYRATAANGADCNAADIICTRIVLTANLKGDKPYVIAFDKGVRE